MSRLAVLALLMLALGPAGAAVRVEGLVERPAPGAARCAAPGPGPRRRLPARCGLAAPGGDSRPARPQDRHPVRDGRARAARRHGRRAGTCGAVPPARAPRPHPGPPPTFAPRRPSARHAQLMRALGPAGEQPRSAAPGNPARRQPPAGRWRPPALPATAPAHPRHRRRAGRLQPALSRPAPGHRLPARLPPAYRRRPRLAVRDPAGRPGQPPGRRRLEPLPGPAAGPRRRALRTPGRLAPGRTGQRPQPRTGPLHCHATFAAGWSHGRQ